MSVLKLKSRLEGPQGLPAWHDAMALQAAIDFSSRGKPMSQSAVQIGIAAKIQVARAEARGQVNMDLEIELSDGEGKVLWETIRDLPPEAFWGRSAYPPLLTIKEMLDEIEGVLSGES